MLPPSGVISIAFGLEIKRLHVAVPDASSVKFERSS